MDNEFLKQVFQDDKYALNLIDEIASYNIEKFKQKLIQDLKFEFMPKPLESKPVFSIYQRYCNSKITLIKKKNPNIESTFVPSLMFRN